MKDPIEIQSSLHNYSFRLLQDSAPLLRHSRIDFIHLAERCFWFEEVLMYSRRKAYLFYKMCSIHQMLSLHKLVLLAKNS